MIAAHYDYHCLDADYRSSRGLSYSESKLLQRTPAHYRWAKDNPGRAFTPTPQMILGTMLHCAVLEPTRFDRDYVLEPEPGLNKNSSAWKTFKGACDLAGQRPITEDERARVFGMRDSLRAHPKIRQVLAHGHPEVSCWWTDKATGADCRARLDWVSEVRGGVLPCDLKTAADASEETFQRSVFNLQYHRQAAWYEDACAACFKGPTAPMLFLVVESSPPFACKPYVLHPFFMKLARDENARLRSIYAHCVEMDEWPAYDPSITELRPPRWALDPDMRRELDAEEEYTS
jgi:hypothetical protein